MAERKQMEAGLQKAHDELEQRAEDRTAGLSRANKSLAEKSWLLTAFLRIGQVAMSSLNLKEILDTLTEQIVAAGIFRSLVVGMVDEAAHRVRVVRSLARHTVGGILLSVPRESRRKVIDLQYDLDDENITAEVVRTGEMKVVEAWDNRFDPRVDRPEDRRGNVAYLIPVLKGDRMLAVLATGSQIEEKEDGLQRIAAMRRLQAPQGGRGIGRVVAKSAGRIGGSGGRAHGQIAGGQ